MATKQNLSDNRGRPIGQLFTEANGDKLLLDAQGRKLGTYHKSSNITLDRTGQLVSYHSDQLLRLLPRP